MSQVLNAVPTFVGIGPGKSGTTWMYQLLKRHPEVFVPSTKETLYFSDYFDWGPAWYRSFFEGAERFRASGEISNTYIFSTDAADRIHRFNPGLKILSSLRNPVDRAFSHYLWLLRNAEVSGSFEDALLQRPDLVTRGLYGRHLRPYLDRFPREQLLLLVFEDLRADPEAFARRILGFVGVDPAVLPAGAHEHVLGAMRPRSWLLARAAKRGAVWLRDQGYPGLLTRIKESFVPRLLYRPIDRSSYPKMGDDTRDRLTDLFREDTALLSSILRVDLETRWYRAS